MTLTLDLLRPDDLLSLHIEAENLKLDRTKQKEPALVLDNPRLPGYLVVTFPPQTVVEGAVYESSPTPAPASEASLPYNTANRDHPAPNGAVPPVKARIGGPSRLVFHIPAGSSVRIPYTTEGLLNWDKLELNVSPIADIPANPSDAERQGAPAIARPGRLETAIELPYRLLLSPNHTAAWQHALTPKTHAGFTELWHTRLALRAGKTSVSEISRANPAPLRAIWSPDFHADKFTGDNWPTFGTPDGVEPPDPDWPGVLTPMTPCDRHEIVVLTSAFSGYVKDTDDFSPYVPQPIYAEQLMLSALGGWLRSRGSWDPPAPFKPSLIVYRPGDLSQWEAVLKDVGKLSTTGHRVALPPRTDVLDAVAGTQSAMAAPAPGETTTPLTPSAFLPFHANEAAMGSLLYGHQLGKTGDLLNMSEWTHIATLGRDHFVRIVYEGHLYPFGHRASLIKITERKIRDVPLPNGSTTPLAYLVQRMFIVVRQPLRDFTDPEVLGKLENGGRSFPFRSVRLTTLVTPDIASPAASAVKHDPDIPALPSFWVRLGDGSKPEDDFKFHAVAEDIGHNLVDLTCSLIFIPFGEDLPSRQHTFEAYAKSGDERAVVVPGQKIRYVPATPGGSEENASLTTSALYFTNQDQTVPVNKRFGGFLPKLFKADVKLPAVETMLGVSKPTHIAYHDRYLQNDPGNVTGLFAQIVEEADPGQLAPAKLLSKFTADQAGGFATPNLSISGLTSQLGPMAGDLANAANDVFKPDDFFKDVKDSAMLFGAFSLTDLLGQLTMTDGAPKIQISQQDLGAVPPNLKFKVTSTLDWTPALQDLSLDFAEFHAGKNGVDAKLAVHGKAEKIVELPPPAVADPGTAEMHGELTSFSIELLHVVEILFDKFSFSSQPHNKLDVSVDLDGDEPVRFKDDLNFVNELIQYIPAGLFGDGPSLDITLTGIKAGFNLGLPPIGVGVFALKDATIAAFLELPFLEGRPLFDFSFSSREHPFNLTVAFMGGGGFFHLQVDTLGTKMLEIALEFGASASIDLGVASGGVHIMAGIYFSLQRHMVGPTEVTGATLAGYLRMGGELSILGLISLSLEFYLAFGYENDGVKSYAYGRATLTVKVEVLFFSTSVDVTVEKRFGGSGGDPKFSDTFDSPAIWNEYAGAFA